MAEQTLNERPERLPSAFDGTELIEVFPTSEGKSYNSPVGTAASKNVGTGTDDVPQNSDLGSAAYLDVGTGATDVPQNSDLGSAAYIDTGTDQSEVVINSGLLRTRTVTGDTTVALTDHLGCIVVDAATADITVPDTLPVGFRFKVLKISSYDTSNADSVDILTSGTEVATVAQLTTVPLYGNGGNWTLEKVSSTRWEIVAGWDAGENSNGTWSRDSGGWQKSSLITSEILIDSADIGSTSSTTGTIWRMTANLPVNEGIDFESVSNRSYSGDIRNSTTLSYGSFFAIETSNAARAWATSEFDRIKDFQQIHTGRWYALS